MKHTVMPLKKKPGRHEIACDVHRVSNLDQEEMVQSACFWVAKNPVDLADPSFKEEVFVNREEEFLDEDASYLIEKVHQSRQAEELNSRTDSPSSDARYTEEKTFYGVRKAKAYEETDVEPFSPLSSPRNQSRMSSLSDDSPSALSSEGTGMRVGWTSDINDSSGPEYAGITDEESEGDGSSRPPRRDLRLINDEWEESMEFYGYRRRQASDKYIHPASGELHSKPRSRDQPRRDLEPNGGQQQILAAQDITSFESNSHVSTYENEIPVYGSRNGFDNSHDSGHNGGVVYPGEENRDSSPFVSNGQSVHQDGEIRESAQPRYNSREIYWSEKTRDADHSVLIRRDYYSGGKTPGDVGGHHGRSVSRTVRGELLPGIRTSIPLRQEFPSSDTELVVQRSYEADVEQSSNYSLPVTLQKATTKFYSVDELRRSSETGPNEHVTDQGQSVSNVPRGNDRKPWKEYEPRRDVESPEDSLAKRGTLVEPERTDVQKRGNMELDSKIVATTYELYKQRPSYIPGTNKEFDKRDKEDVRLVGKYGEREEQGKTLPDKDDRSINYRWEESVDFYGYRRHQADGEGLPSAPNDSHDRPRLRDQRRGDLEISDGQRRLESKDVASFESDNGTNTFKEEKPRYRPRSDFDDRHNSEQFRPSQSRDVYPGREFRGDYDKENVRPREEYFPRKDQPDARISRKEDRSINDRWEESMEFYGYRRRQTDDEYLRPTPSDSHKKPRSRSQRTGDLGPGDGQQRFVRPMDVTSFQSSRRVDTFEKEKLGRDSKNGFGDVPDVGHPFPKDDRDIYPGGEIRVSGSFVSSGRAFYHGVIQNDQSEEIGVPGEGYVEENGGPGEEYVVEKQRQETLTSREVEERQNTAPRGYVVDSQGKTPKSWYPEQTDGGYHRKKTSSEPEFNERKEHDSRTDPKYHPSFLRDPHGREGPQERQRFISHDTPKSEKIVPLSSSPSAKAVGEQKPRFPETTQTSTKRLHTRSQRDILRREARRPDPKRSDDVSDVGMKMFKERSLPKSSSRKHGRSLTSDGDKELPKKIKKPAEREWSKSDPEVSEKFRDITEKRKRKVKTRHSTNTTETSTKSAAENCSKNVDELVDVFNTLKSLQKAANGKGDANVTPQRVRKIVQDGWRLKVEPTRKDGKLSPATSISQKLEEIESILDSVDKNNQQRSHERTEFKTEGVGQRPTKTQPDRKDSYQSSEESRSTRSSLSYNERAKSSDYSEVDLQNVRKSYTSREKYMTREKLETREKQAGRWDHRGDTPWKPVFENQPSEVVTKESFSVESYLESTPNDSFAAPSKQPDRDRPWSHTDGRSAGFAPLYYSRPYKDVNVRLSRDDNDEIYRKQERKGRESKWKSHPSRRKDLSKAYSDGEIEGFKNPYFHRKITPGTPVKIRLYGLNLEKTCSARTHDVDWERFREWEMPVDEDIIRSEIQRPDVEAMLGEEPRLGETDIKRSEFRPGPGIKWSHPPSFKVRKDERQRSSRKEARPDRQIMKEQHVQRASGAGLESNDQVLRREIKWSHPPRSKVRPDKSQSKMPEFPNEQRPDTELVECLNAQDFAKTDIPETIDVDMEIPSRPQGQTENVEPTSDTSHETIRRNITIRSIKREISEDQETRTRTQTEKYPPRKGPWEKYLSEKNPVEEVPSEERPIGVSQKLTVIDPAQILNNDTSDELSTGNQYPEVRPRTTDRHFQYDLPISVEEQPMVERMDVSDELLNDVPQEIPSFVPGVHSSTPKVEPEFSERRGKNIDDENTSRVEYEESSSSDKHESTTRTDHTIYTTRTTRTTRSTTETVVKKVKTSGSESSRSEDRISESVEPDGKTRKGNDASLVAHEYIEVNADTGRPVNLTMLGRVLEDEAEDLSSSSREDLFLHTRLKMVTEKKKKLLEKRCPEDVDAHIRGSTTAEQSIDSVDQEGELTESEDEPDSFEFDKSAGVAPGQQRTKDETPEDSEINVDFAEQLLIPISKTKDERERVDESVEKMEVEKKQAHAVPTEDTAAPDKCAVKTIADEQISRTKEDRPKNDVNEIMSETATRESFEDVFAPVVAEEVKVEAESVPEREMPSLDLDAGQKDATEGESIESYEKSEKPDNFLDFGEPTVPEGVKEEVSCDVIKDEGIILLPGDESISKSEHSQKIAFPNLDQLTSEKSVVEMNEEVSKVIVVAPSLPEFQYQPVEENMSSEERDTEFNFPDLQVAEPEHRISKPVSVDESIFPSKPVTQDVDIPNFQEAMPEISEQSATVVHENIEPRETVTRDQAILDFQEVMPEFEEPRLPSLLDESVSGVQKLKNDSDLTDSQKVVPEFQEVRSVPLNDEDECLVPNDAREPEIQDFQEVVPEFQEVRPALVIDEDATPSENDVQSYGIPDFQEAVPEPPRLLAVAEDDHEVETPDSGSQILSTETEPSSFVNIEITNDDATDRVSTSDQTPKGVEYFEVPRKLPEPEKDVEGEVLTETRSSETITIEKTIRKNVRFVSEIPVDKGQHETPRKTKGVNFANHLQVKDFSDSISESSSETSMQSSSFSSADVSSEMDGSLNVKNADDVTETMETEIITSASSATRKKRNRRGNRFDNVKRSGSLVPDSVVSKTVEPEPENLPPAVPSPHTPGATIARSNVPESRIPDHQEGVEKVPDTVISTGSSLSLARETPSRLRPELYLMASDDSSDIESMDVRKPPEKIEEFAEKVCVAEEKPMKPETFPEKSETERLPEEEAFKVATSGQLADVEQNILPREEKELPEEGTVEHPEKEREDVPEGEVDELSQEQIDELLEKEIQGLQEREINDEEIEKAPEEKSDQLSEEETRESPGEEINDVLEKKTESRKSLENVVVDEKPDEELETSSEEVGTLHEGKPEVLSDIKGERLPGRETEMSIEKEYEAQAEEEPRKLSEQIEKSFREETEALPEVDEELPREAKESIEKETKELPVVETEKAFEEQESFEEQPEQYLKEGIGKYLKEPDDLPGKEPGEMHEEKQEKLHKEFVLATDRVNEEEPEELPNKGTQILIEAVPEKCHQEGPEISGTTVLRTEISIKVSKDGTKEDDDQTPSSNEDITGSRTEVPGGISTKEERTVETIIVEKTYSEVSTTVTETTTTRIPSDLTSSSSEDEGQSVQIAVDIVVESREDDKAGDVNVPNVEESGPGDEITEADNEKPGVDEGSLEIPVQVEKTEHSIEEQIGKGSGDEVDSFDSRLILEKHSESSKDSEKNETLKSVPDECVTSVNCPDDQIPAETVFGILDVKYDEPVSRDGVSMESSLLIEETTNFTDLPLQVVKIRESSESEEGDSSECVEEPPNAFKHSTNDGNEGLAIPREVISSEVCEMVSAGPTREPGFVEPLLEVVLTAEDVPTPRDVPNVESVSFEKEEVSYGAMARRDEEIHESEENRDVLIYGAPEVIPLKTRECESQTENEMYSETTQTEETMKTTRDTSSMTKQSYSITSSFARRESEEHDVYEENIEEYQTEPPKSVSLLIDSEIQTKAVVCNVTTQTDTRSSFEFESNTRWFSDARTTEQTAESSEGRGHVGTVDDETQTDVRSDDSGSQAMLRGTTDSTWEGIGRSDMGTQTENNEGEGSISKEIEVTKTVRKTTQETRSESNHIEHVETITQDSSSDNFKSDCPVCRQSLESTQYSYIKVSELSRFVAMQDFASQTESQENMTDNKSVLCISCGRRQSTEEPLEIREHSRRTMDEWEQEAVVRRESSSTTSEGAHLTIHIEGDENCTLFCGRVGDHTCMLQKLASIMQANRRATADSGATTSRSAEKDDAHESSRSSKTTPDGAEEEAEMESREDSQENGASVVIGGDHCDASVQTEGDIFATDLEAFSENDFEIYYDGKSSPYWFV